jgi:membrane-associated protease RseP (regulator of RpoE activity)
MTPILFAALLTLAQAAPPPPVPPVPPAAPAPPAPPAPAWSEALPSSGFLGVIPGDVAREDVKRLGLQEESGALVREVVKDGPAAKAGLKEGDVITEFGRTPVVSASQLRRLVGETPAGRTVTVRLVRDRQSMEIPVTLGEPDFKVRRIEAPGHVRIHRGPGDKELRIIVEKELEEHREELERAREEMELSREEMEKALQEAELDKKEIKIYLEAAEEGLKALERISAHPDHPFLWLEQGDDNDFHVQVLGRGKPRLGVGLQELTPQLADYFGLKDRDGVLVSSVGEGSAAAKAGMKAGDVILSVGGTAVKGSGDVQRLVAKAEAGALEVKVLRDRREMTFQPVLE